jgi:hypothetical protein
LFIFTLLISTNSEKKLTDLQIHEICKKLVAQDGLVILPEELYSSASPAQAKIVMDYLPKSTLINLPHREIEFFEWLKLADRPVWDDLWEDEAISPYVVSIAFLPYLIDSDYRGFPICDLTKNDNYYFTEDHMVDDESKLLVESSKTLFLEKKKMSLAQILALQISVSPIDIWHFAFKSKITVESAKKAVAELVADGVLVHLKSAEHLTSFIDL